MAADIDPVAHNRSAWDKQVDAGNEWTRPVSPDVIARARQGDWSIVLIGHTPVPRDWFPAILRGVDVLCLASGGGQQGPVLAAIGANVTVFDNSQKQLDQDRAVADREGLCPEVTPVWRECARVLRPGGSLLAGFMNPDLFIFDRAAEEERGELVARHSLPYSDLANLSGDERARLVGESPLEYGHTLTDQVGGQLAAGLVITAFAETPHHASITAKYMPGHYATRAIKPQR